jgi:hypothetical protein
MIGQRHRLRPRTALQHAYWQKWVEGYGMLEERTARAAPVNTARRGDQLLAYRGIDAPMSQRLICRSIRGRYSALSVSPQVQTSRHHGAACCRIDATGQYYGCG